MFVASLSLPPSIDCPPARERASAPLRMLAAWLVAGALLLALFPMLRGGQTLGATVPFWLVAAPAINLTWLARGRIAFGAVRALRRFHRPLPGQARRLSRAGARTGRAGNSRGRRCA